MKLRLDFAVKEWLQPQEGDEPQSWVVRFMDACAFVAAGIVIPLLVVALLALSGCTIMSPQRVEGWPELKVTEHRVSPTAMIGKCYQYVSAPMKALGGLPMACAIINMTHSKCDIYLPKGFWGWIASLFGASKHERKHCDGYEHYGDSTLTDLLARWNAVRARGTQAVAP